MAELPDGGRVLEVALGPGSLAIELAKRGCDATAAEIDAEIRTMGLSRPNAAMTRLTFRRFLLKNAYGAGHPADGGEHRLLDMRDRADQRQSGDPAGPLTGCRGDRGPHRPARLVKAYARP